MRKLNIGCGPDAMSGWINIDNSPNAILSKMPLLKTIFYKIGLLSEQQFNAKWANHSIFLDVRKGLPFQTASVDFIYSSHFLEHISQGDAEKLLLECHRVLKQGGVIHLALPDLEKAVKRYLSGEDSAEDFVAWTNLSRKNSRHSHKWLCDSELLEKMLQKVGFVSVKETSAGKSVIPDAQKLDLRIEDSFFMDAWK